jgi:hypothetical protein
MATYFARASGNINGAIWATTPTGTAATATFTSTDVLCANGISAIVINVNTTVAQIRNDAFNDGANTATAGGGFSLSPGVTLTANLIRGASTLLSITATGTYTINGSVTSSGPAGFGISFSGLGTLNLTGSVSCLAGTGVMAGIQCNGAGTLNITGNVTGGSSSAFNAGLFIDGHSGPINITGDVIGGTVAHGFHFNGGTPPITITGNVIGAAVSGITLLANNNQSITVNGAAVGGTLAPGLQVANAGTCIVTRAKASATQPGVNGGTIGVRVTEVEYGDNGMSPTTGIIFFTPSTSNIALVQMVGGTTAGTKKTLVDPISTGFYPATGDVRSGTTYAGGTRTGTLAVPAASLVAAGVAVDNTTGTAAITSTAMQTACSSALTAFASGRLADVATTATTGQQIADATW